MRLLNHYEELTYDTLRAVCVTHGAKVFPKVRVADVFSLDGSGISKSHYSYGLRAHFDFVVTDLHYQPLFSVEYDGPSHQTDDAQQARDKLKNEICDHFDYSLLRINSKYIPKNFRGLDLLSYFVDAWFLECAFSDAQKQGFIPYDEPFDMSSIFCNVESKDPRWPYWLSLDVQLSIQKLHKQGTVSQMFPSYYVGIDADGNYRCICWILLNSITVTYVTTGIRAQRFPGVIESDLLSMLAMFDLYKKLQDVLSGDRGSLSSHRDFFHGVLPRFQTKFRLAASCFTSQPDGTPCA